MNTTPTRFRTAKPILLSLLLASVAFSLAGCGSDPEPEPQAEPDTAMETAPRPAPIRRPGTEPAMATGPEEKPMPSVADARYQYVPKVEGQLEDDGTGLEMIVDGSSQAAFNDSLALIAESTSAAQYSSLERSIRFINTYDQSVLGNPERMREMFDGMTAQEIIDRAAALAEDRYNRANRPESG
ncbi:hypothetical protein HFP89_02605 [Wenzhouxiangella sp. XN79A]|uniref:hypothetical protein n=1 Tax=Wenzhouxiangella sp. XN79A TaxID=2724193 RepID=UPI00144AF38B|nr:hypothetical protein [Wenzhouxiangella sp. XN79A]NKI34057.1 hypothetical protein [Wenzhouxiangella sp. XN79A]